MNGGNASRQSGRQRPAGHVSLIPAGVPVWGYSDGIDQIDEVRLVLDIDRLKEIMGEEFASAPLQEPRLDTGFSEQSHFGRAFRAATGISPGVWRREMTL